MADTLRERAPSIAERRSRYPGALQPLRAAAKPVSECVGPYRLCFEVASGGMASVYLARVDWIEGIRRFVALKRVRSQLLNDKVFVEMFLDEVRIASQIQHANVCSVFDFGVADGSHYMAMEYLSGETVSAIRRTLLRRSSPPDCEKLAVRAARIVADAAEGIHAAHELCSPSGASLGIVHRDVSPDNVFVTYDGVVKVVDFGVARASVQRHRTRTGVLKGKYAYAAPEMLRGHRPDRRADVWGLGVILWELLTQKRLFKKTSEVDTLQAVLQDPILPPSALRPGVPRELDKITLRALRREPDARYQTARELSRDLCRFVTASGASVGLPELSEWMAELFPVGRERQRRLLEAAERMTDESAPPDGSSPSAEEPERSFDSCATVAVSSVPTARARHGRLLRNLTATATMIAVMLGGVLMMRVWALATAVPKAPPSAEQLPARERLAASPGARLGPTLDDDESADLKPVVPIPLGSAPVTLELGPRELGAGGVVLRIEPAAPVSSSATPRARRAPAPATFPERPRQTRPEPLTTAEPARASPVDPAPVAK